MTDKKTIKQLMAIGCQRNDAAPFHINVRPVSIDFTCPYCGCEQEIPWRELDVPEYWGDDWGDVTCPVCRKDVELGDYDYD